MILRHSLLFLFTLAITSTYGQSPKLTAASPNTGNRGGRLDVKISAVNTKFTQATNTQAYFTQGTSTIVYPYSTKTNSDTELSTDVYFPTNIPVGIYDVVTKDNVHGVLTMPNSFLVQQASLKSVNPNTAYTGQKLSVGISGRNTNFKTATYTTLLLMQGSNTIIYPSAVKAVDNLTINGDFQIPGNAPIGLYDVYAQNAMDGDMYLNRSFVITKNLPKGFITTVDPSSAYRGTKLNVTISGSKTRFAQGSSTVVFFVQGSNTLLPTTNAVAINDSLVTAQLDVPSGAKLGLYRTVVSIPNVENYDKPNSFTVEDAPSNPTNIRMEPDSFKRGFTGKVTLYASGAKFTASNQVSINFAGGSTFMSASSISVENDTTLSMNISIGSSADLGLYEVLINHGYYPKVIRKKGLFRVYQIVGREATPTALLEVFPNPTRNLIMVQGLDQRYTHLKLIDMDGRIQFERHLYNATQFEIDMNKYRSGVYLIEVTGQESTRSVRVVKE